MGEYILIYLVKTQYFRKKSLKRIDTLMNFEHPVNHPRKHHKQQVTKQITVFGGKAYH